MFVWISSHVPSAIALSLFILKSLNWDKINDASYSSLSCGNLRLLIAYNLKLALVPSVQLQNGQKYFVPFYNSILCTLRFPHTQYLLAYFFIQLKHQVYPKDLCLFCVTCIRPLIHAIDGSHYHRQNRPCKLEFKLIPTYNIRGNE